MCVCVCVCVCTTCALRSCLFVWDVTELNTINLTDQTGLISQRRLSQSNLISPSAYRDQQDGSPKSSTKHIVVMKHLGKHLDIYIAFNALDSGHLV